MPLILTPEELRSITGYCQPAKQLVTLHDRGYWRAWMQHGAIILERIHYEAVCAGAKQQSGGRGNMHEPQLRSLKNAA